MLKCSFEYLLWPPELRIGFRNGLNLRSQKRSVDLGKPHS